VRLLLVHPSALMYSEIFLRLEPLGMERVAGAALAAGHEVRVIDLQVTPRQTLEREMATFAPHAIGVSLNYLANIPEAIDLARRAKELVPGVFVFFGGHSVSFVAEDVLAQAEGAVGRRAPAGGGARRRRRRRPRHHHGERTRTRAADAAQH
jgi:magnesium-protoporphyrin IX monomethyl ester (oxidative) cyclase